MTAGARCGQRHHLGRQRACRASTCRWTRSFRRAMSARSIVLPKDLKLREALRKRLPQMLARSSRRCAAASSCCPTGRRCRIRCSSAWWADAAQVRVGRPGQGNAARQPQHARRQRQLERADQGAAPEHRPGQGRAWASRARPSPQAARPSSRAAPSASTAKATMLIDIVLRQPLEERNAITDLGNAYLPTASGKRPADADRQGPASLGARGGVARRPQVRHHGAGRTWWKACRARPSPLQVWPAAAETGRAHAAGLRHRGGGRGGIERARGRAPSPPTCRLMLFIIFTLLMLQLQSFSRAMLVFLTGPLGIAGVAGPCCC
jgi:multidrug efflux pump